MKIIGALTVIISMSFYGFSKCMTLKKCEQALAAVISMLELMKNEICSRKTPLKSILLLMGDVKNPYIHDFSRQLISSMDDLGQTSFREIWCNVAESKLGILPQASLNAIKGLGMSLGKYDAELQKCAIDRCSDILKAEHDEIRSGMKNSSRMYMGLYSGIGFITAIILI